MIACEIVNRTFTFYDRVIWYWVGFSTPAAVLSGLMMSSMRFIILIKSNWFDACDWKKVRRERGEGKREKQSKRERSAENKLMSWNSSFPSYLICSSDLIRTINAFIYSTREFSIDTRRSTQSPLHVHGIRVNWVLCTTRLWLNSLFSISSISEKILKAASIPNVARHFPTILTYSRWNYLLICVFLFFLLPGKLQVQPSHKNFRNNPKRVRFRNKPKREAETYCKIYTQIGVRNVGVK